MFIFVVIKCMYVRCIKLENKERYKRESKNRYLLLLSNNC